MIPIFVGANFIGKLLAPAFQNKLTFKLDIMNYGRIIFLKLNNAVSLLQKKYFCHLFLTQKMFCHKNSKPPWQLTTYIIQELGSRRFFLMPGFGVSSYSNHRARMWYRFYYRHTSRESVSPVCSIFVSYILHTLRRLLDRFLKKILHFHSI